MQFMLLVHIIIYVPIFDEKSEEAHTSLNIMIALLIEHVLAYLAGSFRKWEIE